MTPVPCWTTSLSCILEKTVVALTQELIHLIPYARRSQSSYRCPKRSWERGCALTTGGPFRRFVCCRWASITNAEHVPPTTGGRLSGAKAKVEELWRKFFSDPSQWWDHRQEKANPKYPDFKHKTTDRSLWLNNNLNPPWMEAELVALAPGTLQSTVFSWNLRLRRHVKAGDYKKTMHLFQQMQREGMIPDKFTFVRVLGACCGSLDLEEGKRIHLQIIRSGFEKDVCVGTCLIDMYAKCGRIEDARSVFNKMPTRDMVAWSTLILGYVKCGQGQEALELFHMMQREELNLSCIIFIGVLNACASIGALEEGRHAHKQIVDRGYESDLRVANSLVDMYAKCGSIEDGKRVFDKMPTRNVVSWSALILGYVKSGRGQEALKYSEQMQLEGVDLDPVTFVGILNACASIGALEEGRRAHEQIIQRGYESNVYVANSLVDMYAKCGSIEDARGVFNRMPARDVVSWSALILGYVRCGQGQEALKLSRLMQQNRLALNPVTLIGVLNACSSVGALEEGRCIHEHIIERGYECDVYVASSLIDMYAKCGSIEDARRLFNKMPIRDGVSCNALIVGYVRCGRGQEALEVYLLMRQEGVELSPVTFVGVLNACASIGALEEGRGVHDQIIAKGYESDVYVASSLVDMYAKCGSIKDARRLFDQMSTRDVVSWGALILGYVKCGQGQEALELSQQMQREGVDLNPVTFLGVLKACAIVGALEQGRLAHEQIVNRGYGCDVYVASSLVDMYAKCGSIEDSQRVFDDMPTRDVFSWSAMLAGYCRYGYGKEALQHFERMCQEVQVGAVSFVSLLSACSHGGFVDEGMHYFESISTVFKISPNLEHYACVIDLLGRAGHLHEAEDLIKAMPREPDSSVWMSLLSACRTHGNVELGENVAKRVLVLDPGNTAVYSLLSNIYAAASKWDRVQAVHCERIESNVEKSPGCTWMEVNQKVHSFVANNSNHPQIADILAELERVEWQMREVGYVGTRFTIHFADELEGFHFQ